MNELILHNYPSSPYSEKIRLILGYKRLAFRDVMQPEVMPKPDQIALTGGYRRAPILQIGAHIYCDTNLIADLLERLQPDPTLFPVPVAGTTRMMAAFAEQSLFRIVSILVFKPQGKTVKKPDGFSRKQLIELLRDRAELMQDARLMHVPPEFGETYFDSYMGPLDQQLAQDGPYLCGSQPSMADFATFMCIWFLLQNLNDPAIVSKYMHLEAWQNRMAEFRSTSTGALTSADAVELARKNPPPLPDGAQVKSNQWKAGETIEIVATDYGFEPVRGELIKLLGNEIVIRCTDERAGQTMVHFPVVGYEIRKPMDR